jgi:hypothetical protein
VLGVFTNTAKAGLITGEIAYVGGVMTEDGSGGAASLGTTSYLSFFPSGWVTGANGDFASLSGTLVSLYDFSISPFDSPSDVWSGGGFSFYLTSLVIPIQTDSPFGQLYLSGNGIFTGTGYDDTNGVWALSAQTTTNGTIVAFAATSSEQADVPEPSTLILFGLGLLGLGLTRRLKLRAVKKDK